MCRTVKYMLSFIVRLEEDTIELFADKINVPVVYFRKMKNNRYFIENYSLFNIRSITQLVGVALTLSHVQIALPCKCSTTA